ncbi:MAG: glycosyltransferase [Limosilactobacillus sp.]|uniref:glycosyltransferase n=1 Tax=Limosilactobacillus sp. TaxID=2773925 RepID=UPI0026FF5421|nr:glycosyltransferase [Limosilactobacillus sp.]
MKTSIVVSTYNGENYILDQLDSLRNQTLSPDEVLIFDDGSSDNTGKIVNDYINTHHLDNWTFKVNEQNKGWRRNFMEGMWSSRGDIVFPCDQDDIWMIDKLERMTKVMEENSEIQLLASNYVEFFDNGKTKLGPWNHKNVLEKITLKNNYMSVDAPGCVYCIRKQLLDQSKEYWREEFGHDTLLWRMAELSQTLYVLNVPTIKWRKHNDSSYAKEVLLLKTQNEKKKWLAASVCFNDLMKNYVDKFGFENAKKVIIQTQKWLELRTKFYDSRKFRYGIHLIGYWHVYPRYRQLLGDWYLILLNK